MIRCDSAVSKFEGFTNSDLNHFFFLFSFIYYSYLVTFLSPTGIHCVMWMGFAEEKFLEVAQEINNIKLDGYEFFTESVKESVECKIYRKYDMVSIYYLQNYGWMEGQKKGLPMSGVMLTGKPIGTGEGQKREMP